MRVRHSYSRDVVRQRIQPESDNRQSERHRVGPALMNVEADLGDQDTDHEAEDRSDYASEPSHPAEMRLLA